MAWYSRLFAGQERFVGELSSSQQRLLADWNELPPADLKRSHYRSRYVVVDVETTAVNPKADRLVSIGALAVVDGLIDFKDAFYVSLANDRANAAASPAFVDHPEAGLAPADAMLAFLRFSGKSPWVAYHALFAGQIIAGAMAKELGIELRQPWIDLAWVMSDLFRDVSDDAQWCLDAWLEHFAIESIQRHHVVSDAFVTAKLLQITIARATRKGFETPNSFLELAKARRHMHQSG